jgi:hypothetical protein
MYLVSRFGCRFAGLAALGALLLHAGSAHAQALTCSQLTFSNPIYGSGGSAITPTMARLAATLRGLTGGQDITVLYADPNACQGYQAFLDNTYSGTFRYWAADGTPSTCTQTAQALDFATMGNSYGLCPNPVLPAGVLQYAGPVQALNLIVPVASSQTSISAEALYFIFGFGDNSGVSPWQDHNSVFQRQPTSYASLFLAKAIGVPAASFNAALPVLTTNQAVVDAVVARGVQGSFEAALGYTSGPNAEANPTTVRTLYYQHTGQTCGYLPDSAPGVFDKHNVRSGQYYLWGANQFFARVDAQNQIIHPLVKRLIGYFTGSEASPTGTDLTRPIIETGNIPQCAMRVSRDDDLGPISSYAPPEPCGCYYESIALNATPASCQACPAGDGDCSEPNPKCRFGYCEAY